MHRTRGLGMYFRANGTVTGLTGEIASERVDVAFIARMAEPYYKEVVDFTCVIEDDDLVSLVWRAQELPYFFKIVYTFEWTIWAALGITIVFFVIVLSVVGGDMQQLRLGIYSQTIFRRRPLRTLALDVWGLLLSQGLSRPPRRFRERVLLSLWLSFALVITTAFCGSFTSRLARPDWLPDVDTIQEFINRRLTLLVMSATPLQHFPKLMRTRRAVEDERRVEEMLREPNLGVVMRRLLTPWSLLRADLYSKGRPLLHEMSEALIPFKGVYYSRRGWPLLPVVDKLLIRLREGGFPQRWEGHVIFGAILAGTLKVPDPMDSQVPAKISLEHLEAGFLLLAAGLTTACLTFVWEIVLARRKMTKRGLFKY